jgi:glycosyltransferase involved in cell wall biosynthesis
MTSPDDQTPSGASRPGVSAIVPTRQRPELLARAVASVMGQDYEGDVRCLIVFDQEDPVSPAVDVPEGRSIHLLRNSRSPGLAGGRNTGVLAATTDLVAFCDDDDEWLPGKLRRQVGALATNAAACVVVTGMVVVRESTSVERIPDRPQVTHKDLLRSRVQEVHPSSILARRSAFDDGAIGLVDEDLPGSYGEDYEWLLRASALAPIEVVRSPLVRVHWHSSSFFADRWATIIDAIQYLVSKHPDLRSDPRGLARLYGRIAFAHAALGNRAEARSWARRTLRIDPRERRAYLAAAVSTGAVSAETLMKLAHRVGRGI